MEEENELIDQEEVFDPESLLLNSEKETEEVAAGNTIAVERYKGVINKEATIDIIVALAVNMLINFLFNQIVLIREAPILVISSFFLLIKIKNDQI